MKATAQILTASPAAGKLWLATCADLVKARLTKGGVFTQWIPYHLLSNQDTRMMVKTFAWVFPRANVWHIPASGDIILVGAISGPLEAGQVIQRRERLIGPVVLRSVRVRLIKIPGERTGGDRDVAHSTFHEVPAQYGLREMQDLRMR